MGTYCIAEDTLLSAQRGDICKHKADSLCCIVETNTTL